MLRTIRTFVVVAGLLVFGGAYLSKRVFGAGSLHVVTVGGSKVELLVDDEPVKPRYHGREHSAFRVSQGHHEVTVNDSLTGGSMSYSIDIDTGFDRLLLATREDQCFVRFDMTQASYKQAYRKKTKARAPAPMVHQLYLTNQAPIPVSDEVYFTLNEMPRERRETEQVYVVRSMPCSVVESASEDLLLVSLTSRSDDLFTNLEGIQSALDAMPPPDEQAEDSQ